MYSTINLSFSFLWFFHSVAIPWIWNILDESEYFIKVEIGNNTSFISAQDKELNEDVLIENEDTPIQQNRDITLFQNITMFDNVNQAANEVSSDCSEHDLAITPIHEQSFNNLIIDTDTYEENVPQYTFSEIYDEFLDETFVCENVDVDEEEVLTKKCVPLKVKLFTTGVPLIKDMPKRKRKRGHWTFLSFTHFTI